MEDSPNPNTKFSSPPVNKPNPFRKATPCRKQSTSGHHSVAQNHENIEPTPPQSLAETAQSSFPVESPGISLEKGFWGSPMAEPPVIRESEEASPCPEISQAPLYPDLGITLPKLEPKPTFEQEIEHNEMTIMSVLFSYKGRIPRSTFWIYGFITGSVYMGLMSTSLGQDLFAVLVTSSMMIWMGFALYAKRYHDLNKSGFWSLLVFVPVVSIWVFIETGFIQGQSSSNQYGPPC